jgi:tetratricopeptide (TPR) repeat protein
MVEAVDASGAVVGRGVVDGRGQAQLGRIAPGCYHVRPAKDWSIAASSACVEVTWSPVPVVKEVFFAGQQAESTEAIIAGQAIVSIRSLNVPAAAQRELAKARAALQADRFADVAKHVALAIKTYADYPEAHNLQGFAYLRAGDLRAARSEFQDALRLEPKFADAHRHLARIAAAEGDFLEAIRELKEALTVDPSDSESWTLLAFAQSESGQLNETLRSAERAHETGDRNSAAAHFVAASVLAKQGRMSEAVAQLKTYLHEDPNGRYAERSREFLNRSFQ